MRKTHPLNLTGASLWASAFVIVAIIIVQAGQLPGNTAHAEMAAEGDFYRLITTNSGRGDDAAPYELLYVLDSRDGVMLVYEIDNAQTGSVILRGGGSVETLFRAARR